MYKIFTTLFCIFFFCSLRAQYNATIKVIDEQGQAYQGLKVQIVQLQRNGITDSLGSCRFTDLPSGTYALSVDYLYDVAYKTLTIGTRDTVFQVQLERRIEFNELLIQAYQLSVSKYSNSTNLSADDIQQFDKGRDIPYVLRQVPGLIVQSDAGNGIGYTGLRFRGLDPAHIQMTMNGIPFTDAESSLSYFVDIPNILSGTKEIDVIRGNVPNKSGAPSFGGALDLQTNQIHFEPFAELNTEFGSFGTFKYALQASSGLVGDKWNFNVDLSRHKSDGYIERSASDLKSFRISAALVKVKYALRLNYIHGSEKTDQAWFGLPWKYEKVDSLRRFNLAGTEKQGDPYDNEIDQYSQDHIQIFFQREISDRMHINLVSNYTHGKGFYENYKSNQNLESYGLVSSGIGFADLIRQKWLDNDFLFLNGSATVKLAKNWNISPQATYSYYHGDHFGIVKQALLSNYQYVRNPYYENSGIKKEITWGFKSVFSPYKDLNLNLDLQWRWIDYSISGTEDENKIDVDANYTLFTPKIFMDWGISKKLKGYGSAGIMRREAFREDLLADPEGQQAEELWDGELGFNFILTPKISAKLNMFYMHYKRLRALSGELNDVGEPLRIFLQNVKTKGVEYEMDFQVFGGLKFKHSASLLWTRIPRWEETIPSYDSVWNSLPSETISRSNVSLGFSPKFVSESRLSYLVYTKKLNWPSISFYVDLHTMSEFYLDNTERKESQIPSQLTMDFGLETPIHFSKKTLLTAWFQFHNLLGNKTSSHGWISRFKHQSDLDVLADPYLGKADDGYYFYKGVYPQALQHLSAGLRLHVN